MPILYPEGAPVKMRPPNDPVIQQEVRSLIARMKSPEFLGDLAHELVNLRAENAAMRSHLIDLQAEDMPGVLPDDVSSWDANGSEVQP